jgi:hypothetical protein
MEAVHFWKESTWEDAVTVIDEHTVCAEKESEAFPFLTEPRPFFLTERTPLAASIFVQLVQSFIVNKLFIELIRMCITSVVVVGL